MQGVVVTAQTVQGSLVFVGLFSDNGVRLAVWRSVGGSGSTAVSTLLGATKSTGSTDEESELVLEQNFAGFILGGDRQDNRGTLALIEDFNDAGIRDKLAAGGDRLLEFKELLTVQQHHLPEN